MRIFKITSVFFVLFLLVLLAQVNTASALTLCSGQPATLHWATSGVTACTPSNDNNACNFTVIPNTPGSRSISLSSGSCNVQLTCNGVTKTNTLTVNPALGTWNGTRCVVPSYQCPSGYAYVSQSCVACSNGGCTGAGGGASNPLGSLGCINGASNPKNCKAFPPAAPSATLSPPQVTIVKGQSTILTWITNHTSGCYPASGDMPGDGFSTGGASNGNDSVSPTETSYYQISCTSPTVSSNISTVTVLTPTVSISAEPARVHAATAQGVCTAGPSLCTTSISWNASQVNSCVTSGPNLSSTNLSGSQSVTITAQSTYTITCQTNGSLIPKSVTVNIIPLFQEF